MKTSSAISIVVTSLLLLAYVITNNANHHHDNETNILLGSIQEEVQLLKEVVQTLVPLVNVVHKEVGTNTNNIQTLTDNVVSYSKKVDSVTKTVNSVIKTVTSVAKTVNSVSLEVNLVSSKVKSVSSQVNSNSKQLAEIVEQCRSLPSNICGSCICRDDKRLPKKYYCDCTDLPAKRDCKQFHQEGFKLDGVYKIHQNNIRIIQIFCDQTSDGGGWSVFQRRLDGSVKFYRDWSTYKAGFGDLQHEFWLGNTNLFTLTLQGLYPSGNELRIELTDWNGAQKIAKYGSFEISNEDRKFQLTLGGYSGTAGDSLSYHNGMKFSTFDQDNDPSGSNCAVKHMGAWWYRKCYESNLNGVYYDYQHWKEDVGICWAEFQGYYYSLKHVEMKVRRKN